MAHTGKKIKDVNHPVILALETATMCGSVAIISGKRCLAEFSLQSGETHSRRLLAAVDRLLQEAKIDCTAVDAVAVSQGPGSFTGLRIGLATAKGLAMAAGTKVIGVGTLDGLAAQIFTHGDMLICPVLDARKKEVYTGFYRGDSNGIPRLQGEYLAISPADLCAVIDEPVLFLGDGITLYGDLFRAELADLVIVPPAGIFFPRAAAVGLLALEKWHRHEFLDAAGSEPLYIRLSEAEMLFGK
ncbi:MAG: tRNA (adenosine(37)-N6)-threonylcarbamoyltransferase complex dimerization subunit type 1 TsaB [Desulfobulbales bacterium]|nr:tRNA (adenosine(37)-N6)-threonylcarbamoyltransferase complex dimerization subunit type 1 TsaB [Desulfobulbales bacterium]